MLKLRTLSAVIVLVVAGCSDVPALHPVRGSVIVGDEVPSAGGVLFVPETPARGWIVSGEVKKDGTFVLQTVITGGDLDVRPGAPAGKYTVTYQKLTSGQEQNLGTTINDVEIRAGDNELKLVFPPLPPSQPAETGPSDK